MSLTFDALKDNFGSLVDQTSPNVLLKFVIWLDVKVAEYKVHGRLLINSKQDLQGPSTWLQLIKHPDIVTNERNGTPHGDQTAGAERDGRSISKRQLDTTSCHSLTEESGSLLHQVGPLTVKNPWDSTVWKVDIKSATEKQTCHGQDKEDDPRCIPTSETVLPNNTGSNISRASSSSSSVTVTTRAARVKSAPIKKVVKGVHTYLCPFCKKWVRHTSNYWRHLKIHKGRYMYHCNACQRGFFRKSNFVTHNCQRRSLRGIKSAAPDLINSGGKTGTREFKEVVQSDDSPQAPENGPSSSPNSFTLDTISSNSDVKNIVTHGQDVIHWKPSYIDEKYIAKKLNQTDQTKPGSNMEKSSDLEVFKTLEDLYREARNIKAGMAKSEESEGKMLVPKLEPSVYVSSGCEPEINSIEEEGYISFDKHHSVNIGVCPQNVIQSDGDQYYDYKIGAGRSFEETNTSLDLRGGNVAIYPVPVPVTIVPNRGKLPHKEPLPSAPRHWNPPSSRQVMVDGRPCFVCSICDKTFTQQGNCTRHMKIHTGSRDYVCLNCGKAFFRKDHLKSHVCRASCQNSVL